MSRSYRHTHIRKDNRRGRKCAKRYANEKVRNYTEVANGNYYKKISEQWNIYDYISYWPLEWYLNWIKKNNFYYNSIGRLDRIDERSAKEITDEWKKDYY